MTPKNLIINLLKAGFIAGILYYLLTNVAYYEITPGVLEELNQQSVTVTEAVFPLMGERYDTQEAFETALQDVLPAGASMEPVLDAAGQARLNLERLALFLESPATLVLIVALLLLAVIPLTAFRWWLLLKGIGLQVPFSRAYLLTWIGVFFNTTLPGAVSGDVVKGYYIIRAQEKEGKTRAFTTLLIDRFVGLFGLIVMAFIALFFNLEQVMSQASLQSLAGMIITLAAITIVFYAIVLFPFREGRDPFLFLFERLPGRALLTKVYLAFKRFQHEKSILLATLGISVLVHCCIAMMFFQIAELLEIHTLQLATQLFIMPIGMIAIAIPVAPGGIGVGHVAFQSLYSMLGIQGGADIFNMYVIVQLMVFLLGGIPYFLYKNDYQLPENIEEE